MTIVSRKRSLAPIVDEDVKPLFNGAVKQVIVALIELMNTVAEEENIPVGVVQVRRFRDNKQGCPRLVVEQQMMAADEARARFLDHFTDRVDRWYQPLPDDTAALFIDKLLFDFRWSRSTLDLF